MFNDFTHEKITVTHATLNVRYGGNGPPVLLLHGHPRTHMTWSKVAPRLAKQFSVVCPDLRGFGQSSVPVDTPDNAGSAKRAKAQDCVELMQALGFPRFAIVGHDRGSYTAYRAALDFPHIITRLAVLDSVPILEALERCNEKFARQWYHWFFFAQKEKPERAILADPDAWYGGRPAQMNDAEYADFHRAIHDPATVHGMLEDYRMRRRTAQRGVKSAARRSACGRRKTTWSISMAMCWLSGETGLTMCGAGLSRAGTIWRRKPPKRWRKR